MKYSVTEFRKDTRKILDAVDGGAEVMIERYDKLYSIKLNNAAVHPRDVPTAVGNGTVCPHGAAKGMCKKDNCNRKFV